METDPGLAAATFLRDFERVLRRIELTDACGGRLTCEEGSAWAVAAFRQSSLIGGQVGFIGNGGSAAISSHLAVDMWKNGRIKAIAFNDAALLTCVANDCGWERVFEEAVRTFMRPGDTLVAVSSSGRSPNILNAVQAARDLSCAVVTLSGFDADNPLRSLGDINFYIASQSYGLVEAGHLAILHSLLDSHMGYPKRGRRRPRAVGHR